MILETVIYDIEAIEVSEPLELRSGRWNRDVTIVTETGRYTISLYSDNVAGLDITEQLEDSG